MSTIYVTNQGAVIRKTSKRFTIEKGEETLLTIPDFKGSTIADSIAVKLFRKREINPSNDFEFNNQYGFLLKDEARKIVLREYESKMESVFEFKEIKTNFRKIIIETVDRLANFINRCENFAVFTLEK